MKFVAKVVTNDGTFNSTVIKPLISPTPAQTTSATRMAHPTGSPSCQVQYMTHGREEENLARGEVDLPHYQHEHLADGDRSDRPGVAGGRVQAEGGEKRGRVNAEVDEQGDRDDDRGDLALRNEEMPDTPARAPLGGPAEPTGSAGPDAGSGSAAATSTTG